MADELTPQEFPDIEFKSDIKGFPPDSAKRLIEWGKQIARLQLAKRGKPDREKIRDLMYVGWILGNAKMDKQITNEEFSLYIDDQAASFLALYDKPKEKPPRLNIEEELRTEIANLAVGIMIIVGKLKPEDLSEEDKDRLVALYDKPKEKPPLLSDEQILAAPSGETVYLDAGWQVDIRASRLNREREIAQAQRNSDIEWYEGVE
jgi:hypothetical protein